MTAREDTQKGQRSVKRAQVAKESSAYQKEWFMGLGQRVADDEPFDYLNADVPMEIFRAMDIPFVVNQWWASICAAKQMTPYYFNLLKEQNYRDDVCQYCVTALACSFDPK